jgi:hypothetical protein
MRAVILAVVMLMAPPMATAQGRKPTAADRVLSPAEVVSALDGRILCARAYPGAPVCDNIIEISPVSETRLRFRDIGVMGISNLSSPPMVQFLNEIETIARHRAVFQALEAQRVAGGFEYVRIVEVFDIEWREEVGKWCATGAPDYNLANLQFAFARDTSADSEVEPFAPETMESFRVFLREVVFDPTIEQMTREDEELRLLRESLIGENNTCVIYFGVGSSANPTITRREHSRDDGVPMPFLDDHVTMHASSEGLQMTP